VNVAVREGVVGSDFAGDEEVGVVVVVVLVVVMDDVDVVAVVVAVEAGLDAALALSEDEFWFATVVAWAYASILNRVIGSIGNVDRCTR
jgi:hypothetical protein